ncbi:thiosulfate oxidation carrier complex protein SoxZ [Alkalilimnicola ehrlichii]|uniref:Thiosulfate oxidation carrier complex protein SoxZ n=1 Tax=Alkalilimnicola ehrlichii TaxID=351052 RepID=A0A3E0WTA9_9GAMM|nr:thiosulfate oxidation carrier complex protein SoxZ [Alkalilimnicola ehrlichii]RFA29165.1 thiosulfate oxidation carrier complex protein SoxZ [Alkalilimnicola ehrlichii]RFA36078.1 thiosulfate oxidation carrier complex protein SoxZ [Alkalilimnicola ehrlichii]
MTTTIVTRFLRRTVAGLSIAAALTLLGSATAYAAPVWERFEPVKALLDGATPRTNGIGLDIPLVSEDGSSVPLTVTADSRMRDDDYIEEIHLFATRNPNPEIASFRLTPHTGLARIATRIRLNETQEVIAVARTNSGEYLVSSREARVTVNGCLTRADTYDADNIMNARYRVPNELARGEIGEVLTMINHPMETGLREGADGEIIPRRLINRFTATLDDRTVLEARFNTSISANPYLRFHVRPEEAGTLTLAWEDETGAATQEKAPLQVR